MRKFPRILFFIIGPMPTSEQFDAAEEFGPNVAFRNATLVSDEGALENCDGVTGEVPKRYKDRPTAKQAIKKWQVDEMERRSRRAAGLPEEPVAGETTTPVAETDPPSDKQHAPKGSAAVKEPTPAPAAAAGWKANK